MELITFSIIYILIIAFFIGYAIYSNKKRKQRENKLYENLKIGKKVITIGGIHGIINKIDDTTVEVKVDGNFKITFNKTAISKVLD